MTFRLVVAALLFCGIILPEALSMMWADYSSAAHDLIELGTVGSSLTSMGVAIGYMIVVFCPCDAGCPVDGSVTQAVHNLAGRVQYPLGAIGLILMDKALLAGILASTTGLAMALGFVMMLLPDQRIWRGAWQRLGDYSTVIAIACAALLPLLRPNYRETP